MDYQCAQSQKKSQGGQGTLKQVGSTPSSFSYIQDLLNHRAGTGLSAGNPQSYPHQPSYPYAEPYLKEYPGACSGLKGTVVLIVPALETNLYVCCNADRARNA